MLGAEHCPVCITALGDYHADFCQWHQRGLARAFHLREAIQGFADSFGCRTSKVVSVRGVTLERQAIQNLLAFRGGDGLQGGSKCAPKLLRTEFGRLTEADDRNAFCPYSCQIIQYDDTTRGPGHITAFDEPANFAFARGVDFGRASAEFSVFVYANNYAIGGAA